MVIEIRTYRLKPGTRSRFLGMMTGEVATLLEAAGIRVIAAGASLAEEEASHETAFLIRAFADVGELETQECRFYASPAWVDGPRAAVLDCIEHYTSVVVPPTALVALGNRS